MGLILVCEGAGGHAGTLSPFALIEEVRRFCQGPVALAGAIATGRGVFAARAMGADFAYVGTRFIAQPMPRIFFIRPISPVCPAIISAKA
jgi:nitronate monooxygenase